jgi:hypothetical protein
MKNYLLLLSLLVVAAYNCSAQANSFPKQKPNEKLTATDRKNYVLTANVKRIKSYDSVGSNPPFLQHRESVHFLKVPVKLTNNSPVILEYMSMSCGWDEIYCTNNENILHQDLPCDKNVPVILNLAPQQSKTVWLTLYLTKRQIKNNKLRVGMILKQVGNIYSSFPPEETARKDKQDVIWSNQITLPE